MIQSTWIVARMMHVLLTTLLFSDLFHLMIFYRQSILADCFYFNNKWRLYATEKQLQQYYWQLIPNRTKSVWSLGPFPIIYYNAFSFLAKRSYFKMGIVFQMFIVFVTEVWWPAEIARNIVCQSCTAWKKIWIRCEIKSIIVSLELLDTCRYCTTRFGMPLNARVFKQIFHQIRRLFWNKSVLDWMNSDWVSVNLPQNKRKFLFVPKTLHTDVNEKGSKDMKYTLFHLLWMLR